jgi:putative transcriptional regulator
MQKPGDPSAHKRVIGNRIREQRKRQEMTQERLADLAELDRKHIGMIETGQAEPRSGTLIRIAGALDIPVEKLITGLVFVPNEHSAGWLEVRGS